MLSYKRFIAAAVLLILAVCSGGCGRYSEKIEDDFADFASFPDYVYDQEKTQLSVNSGMAVSSDGYFFTTENILYFYNCEKNSSIPLCSKSNCRHEDNTCDAYVNKIVATGEMSLICNCESKTVIYYDDCIYMIERNGDMDYILNQYDKNFNNKKNISVISSHNENNDMYVSGTGLISDSYFYYCVSLDGKNTAARDYMDTYVVKRVSIKSGGKPEELGSFTFASDYTFMAGDNHGIKMFDSEGCIYTVAGSYYRTYSDKDSVQYKVLSYSEKSGEFNQVTSMVKATRDERADLLGEGTGYFHGFTSEGCMDDNSNLYCFTSVLDDTYNTQIVKINLKNNTSEVIYKTSCDEMSDLTYENGRLFFIEQKYTEAVYLTSVDLNGEDRKSLQFDYTSAYNERIQKRTQQDNAVTTGGLSIYGADDRYIMVSSITDVYKGLSNDNFSELDKICGVGVINREEFLKGNDVEIIQIY